jgi:hypothetical protein
LFYFIRYLLKPLLGARCQYNRGALSGEGNGRSLTNTGGCTGDENNFVG